MIKLIGTEGCAFCKVLKIQLEKEGVEFEYSVDEKDLAAAERAIVLEGGMLRMPIVERDGQYYGGATLETVKRITK